MMRQLLFLVLFGLSVSPVFAHDYWLKPTSSGAELVYGHEGESDPYERSVLKEMKAFDSKGKALEGTAVFKDGKFQLSVAGAAGYFARVDDGPWVKTVRGWKRGTKKTQGRVLRSSWDKYYTKSSKGGGPALGLTLEIVIEKVTSDTVQGKVLFEGQPLPSATLQANHKKVGKTDSKGGFQVKSKAGETLILRVAHKVKMENDAEVDWSQHISTLSLRK